MLTDYNEYLEGVKIWYNGTTLNWRNVSEEEVIVNPDSGCLNGSLTNVDNSGSSSYILTGLMPYMQYDIFLMPFYKMLLGKPSNTMTSFTEEEGKLCYLLYEMSFSVVVFMFSVCFSAICTSPKRDGGRNKRNVGVDTVGATTCEYVERRTHRLFGKFRFNFKLVNCLLYTNFYARVVNVSGE